MGSTEILESVRDVCAEILGVPRDSIEPSSQLRDDLGADSLDFVELVMALEDRTGVSIPEQEFREVKAIEDVVAVVTRHQASISS